MYNDTIKTANKIISYDDLYEIFSVMSEKMNYYQKIAKNEEMKNNVLEYQYQSWTLKYFRGEISFDVNFYDDTKIEFDNYNSFIGIFNSRLNEIKRISVSFRISHTVALPGMTEKSYRQHISMYITETGIEIDVSLSAEDKKLEDIYNLIKNKILNSPEKYDIVIKKKKLINTAVTFGLGLIPALVITTLLLFIPAVRNIFAVSYVLYPISCFAVAFFIGQIISSAKLDHLYKNITPDKKYVGYDSNRGESIYKDDIENYVQTSEILIGNNVDNLKCREEIMDCYNKYKKNIPIEVIIVLVLSIIVLFLGEV